MRIKSLYLYPIKSLRGISIDEALATRLGFPHDRSFMLLKVISGVDGAADSTKTMHVPHFPEMSLFITSLEATGDGTTEIVVDYRPPGKSSKQLRVPLEPDVSELGSLHVRMWNTSTPAYNMGETFNSWFGECFGFPVIFAYIGDNSRDVLMKTSNPDAPKSWLSRVTSAVGITGEPVEKLTFQDCASYLVVSDTSVQNVSQRLPDGVVMDETKFRPNIVIEGAPEPFEEDFWGEITVSGDSSTTSAATAVVRLPQNCVRCKSLNIDYGTGKMGTGEEGQVLKKLQKDRRVDGSKKYSPVFGRYGYLERNSGGIIKVGDEVSVTLRNQTRTGMDWPMAEFT
ncbi:hypothetical protein P152DRAFT_428252 [Eremomyces bilateralis CBS 781.70]|uniref:MOSC domain-containing protein n=1 Tax=Eremomyces bilateralis CBS 781.70 TaxID=1392243 RepID=A0A6G1GEJ7_9PEZI|nr:uncharacterized protein P152DRAFT_428252 [Eremomyces bilateralis CBS 781.70]KAF1816290.1 hypothetical protein P152DRAFT_428252 [Eremomyces bilateralis CBS 781.70]